MGTDIQQPGKQHNNGQDESQQLTADWGHSRKQYSHAYLSERSEKCSVLTIQVGHVELVLEVVK
jgi:hypothetical protein